MKKIAFLLCSLYVVVLSGCYYDVEEELYPQNGNACDTSSVTYSLTVKPIIDQNCMSCHSQVAPQGGVVLQTYNELIVFVNSGQFLGAIRHDNGFTPMPQGLGKLSSCNILKIEKWILSGSPNN